jgi:hypothetical protein
LPWLIVHLTRPRMIQPSNGVFFDFDRESFA